jgi:hypothetical protein
LADKKKDDKKKDDKKKKQDKKPEPTRTVGGKQVARNTGAPAKRKATSPQPMTKGLTPEENRLFDQERADYAKIAKGSTTPAETKKLLAQAAEDQFKEDALTGLRHPDAAALVKAGVDPKRVTHLTQQYAPSHPANAGLGLVASPTTPQQYAADVLTLAGLPDTASNEALLQTQMRQEGMPGGEDNPLATTVKMPGSSSVNSAGVQQYPSLMEGAQAEAATLNQANMKTIHDALMSGTATPQQYAQGLASSAYEGYDPAANAAYANSFLQDAGQPEMAFPGGGAGGYSGGGAGYGGGGSQALTTAAGTNLFGGIPNLGGTPATTTQSLQNALAGLSSNAEQQTLTANTSNAPGSPDRPASATQQTNVNPAAQYQAVLAALLPGITPGSAGKNA